MVRQRLGRAFGKLTCPAFAGAIDPIGRTSTRLQPRRPIRRIGGNTQRSQMARKVMPPAAQHRLLDVQASAVFAEGFHEYMDMRMGLIRVQHQGVAMLQRKLLPREVPDRFEHLVRRRSGRHREHQLVYESRRLTPASTASVKVLPVAAARQLPVLQKFPFRLSALDALPVIRLELQLAFATEVGQMVRDGFRIWS